MVKKLLNNKSGEDELSLDKLTTQLNEQNMRIQKLQDLYVDGNIDNENVGPYGTTVTPLLLDSDDKISDEFIDEITCILFFERVNSTLSRLQPELWLIGPNL